MNLKTTTMMPEALVLVMDEKSPLYDPRIKLPISEGMVKSIAEEGIYLPVLAFKDDDGKVVVIDGIQRVRNCAEANKALAKEGKPVRDVPVRLIDGTDVTKLFAAKCVTNEIRQDDPPCAKGEKMQRLLNMDGQSPDSVALAFGTSKSEVQQHIDLLKCPAGVRKVVDDGVLAVSAAVKLKDMDPEKANEILAKAKEATLASKRNDGKISVRATKEALKEAKGNGPTAPSKGKLIEFKKAAKDFLTEEVDACLTWVTTGRKTGVMKDIIAQYEEKKKEEAEEAERKKTIEKENARVAKENAKAKEKAEREAKKKADKEALEKKLKEEDAKKAASK